MGRNLFMGGVAFFWLGAIAGKIFDAELTPDMMAEGYAYATGIMVMGIGLMQITRKGE